MCISLSLYIYIYVIHIYIYIYTYTYIRTSSTNNGTTIAYNSTTNNAHTYSYIQTSMTIKKAREPAGRKANISVRVLPSFQQPTFQRMTKQQRCSYSKFKCFLGVTEDVEGVAVGPVVLIQYIIYIYICIYIYIYIYVYTRAHTYIGEFLKCR